MEGKQLITTDNWFYAPNGLKYKAAWGEVKVLEDSILGIKTNRNASNWFVRVGTGDKSIIIAGCQIHYSVQCAERPNTEKVDDMCYDSNSTNSFTRPSEIYIAE